MKTIIVLASVATVCLVTVWISSKLVIFRGAPYDGLIRKPREGDKRMKGSEWFVSPSILHRLNSERME
jgi:hypothetical protein